MNPGLFLFSFTLQQAQRDLILIDVLLIKYLEQHLLYLFTEALGRIPFTPL